MTDSLSLLWQYLQVIGYPACFIAGLWWASRPQDVYHEDGGWRHEEAPAFYRTKESEE